jgi:hypothetical protein
LTHFEHGGNILTKYTGNITPQFENPKSSVRY